MSLVTTIINGANPIATADSTANVTYLDVIGNKTDVANSTADQASVIGLIRYIIANLSDDTDVAALIGALNTAAHTGAVDNATTIMGYVKQLITDLRSQLADGGDASGSTLGSLYAILGNPATSLATQIAAIKTLTDNLPANTSTTLSGIESKVDAIDDYVDTEVAAIKAKTDLIGTVTNSGGTATLGAIIGDFANVTMISKFTSILDALYGTSGIATFPAASAAGNNVSLAEVIRYIQESQIGAITNSGGTATIGAVLGDFANTTLISKLTTLLATTGSNDSSGTYTYLNAGIEQTVVTITTTTRKVIQGIWLDLSNMTQNGTIKVYHKIDGTNYREVKGIGTTFTVATDADGIYLNLNMGITSDLKVTYTEGGDEGTDRAIPYSVIYAVVE